MLRRGTARGWAIVLGAVVLAFVAGPGLAGGANPGQNNDECEGPCPPPPPPPPVVIPAPPPLNVSDNEDQERLGDLLTCCIRYLAGLGFTTGSRCSRGQLETGLSRGEIHIRTRPGGGQVCVLGTGVTGGAPQSVNGVGPTGGRFVLPFDFFGGLP